MENKKINERNFLFVDGTNMYAGQYELFGPEKYLDFSLLINELQQKLEIKFNKIYFYASYSPNPKNPTKKEKKYLKNEALFYKSAKLNKNVIFFTGYRSKTSGKEKEVDVKLTADIITYAFLNKYNNAYLITEDADFLQALFSIKKFHNKKKIALVFLENKIMYQGMFYFKTYLLVLKNEPIFRRVFKNLSILKIPTKNVVKNA